MNDLEVQRIDLEIRELLAGTVIEWVLDEVDAAIAGGVPEERILRSRAQRSRRDPSSGGQAAAERFETIGLQQADGREYETSRKSGRLVITTRVMTRLERVQLLLEALSRVLLELPEIELEAIKLLGIVPESDKGTRVEADGIAFAPDEATRHPRERPSVMKDRLRQADREDLRRLFTSAQREVRVD